MLENGELDSAVDPGALAEALIAIVQGGYLLSSIKRDIRPMSGAVDAAVRYLRSNLAPNRGRVVDERSR